jgi:hypothetical protein
MTSSVGTPSTTGRSPSRVTRAAGQILAGERSAVSWSPGVWLGAMVLGVLRGVPCAVGLRDMCTGRGAGACP